MGDIMELLWLLLTPLFTLSFIYGGISIFSIISKLRNRVWINPEVKVGTSQNVVILLPLYKERFEDVRNTFLSIISQDYPKDKITLVTILEKDDSQTLKYVDSLKHMVVAVGIKLVKVINESGRRGKAYALNKALNVIPKNSSIVIVYDSGDIVKDRYYIAKVTKLINEGYDVVGAKVYRVGGGVIGKLSYLDTLLWYNVALPGLTKLIGYPLVSGEGLAVSTKFLREIGGFPEKLTEDSYMTMLVALKNRKAALIDSIIYEGAPSTLRSLIKQRLRWYKGYLECLWDLISVYSRCLNPLITIKLLVAYMEPLALISTMLSFIVVGLALTMQVIVPYHVFYMAFTVFMLTLFAPLYVILDLKVKDPIVILAPLYWAMQGLISIIALLPIKVPWLRTLRTPLHQEYTTRFEMKGYLP